MMLRISQCWGAAAAAGLWVRWADSHFPSEVSLLISCCWRDTWKYIINRGMVPTSLLLLDTTPGGNGEWPINNSCSSLGWGYSKPDLSTGWNVSQTLVCHPDRNTNWLLVEPPSVDCRAFLWSINRCSIDFRLDKCLLRATEAELTVWHRGQDCRTFGHAFQVISCDSGSLFSLHLLIRFSAKLWGIGGEGPAWGLRCKAALWNEGWGASPACHWLWEIEKIFFFSPRRKSHL